MISIVDTGSGIPLAFRARIFDKFFRLEHHQTETRPLARGAGIGLYMCRQIVELHGGKISCSAGRDERGTCITVSLPTKRRVEAAVLNDAGRSDRTSEARHHRRPAVTEAPNTATLET